jgi:YgiT-type zinc finger domain-containing protein
MEQELGERMRTWRKAHPKATLYEIEKELDEQIAVLRAELLGETARAGEELAGKEAVACPECGKRMEKDGRRKRKLQTTGGEAIELERQYMRCPQCGYGVFPPG